MNPRPPEPTRPRPPALFARLLEWRLGDDVRARAMRGDLLEEFRARHAEDPRAVRWWYRRQATSVLVRVRPVRTGRTATEDRTTTGGWAEMGKDFWNDLRFALRLIAKRPLASAAIVLTLALGIGVNVTFFSGFSGMVVSPLPFPDADRLVSVTESHLRSGNDMVNMSAPNLDDIRERSHSFEALHGIQMTSFNLAGDGRPERVDGARIEAGTLAMAGIDPMLGREFTADEDRPGGAPVALIDHRLWRDRFAGSPDVLGRSILVDDLPHEIVGVVPEGVQFPHFARIWTPMQIDFERAERGPRWIWVMGRLAPGATVAGAQAELASIGAALEAEYPETNDGWTFVVRELQDDWMPSGAQMGIMAQQLSVSLILFIVLANVVNLMLAQTSGRRQELAVRLALGASRGRVARLIVAESLVLAIVGGALGTALAAWGSVWITTLVVIEIPYWVQIGLDGRSLVYALVVTLALGVVLGLVPAYAATRRGALRTLGSSGRVQGGSGTRFRSGLVVAQLALSLAMVSGSLLVVRSLIRMNDRDRGHAVEDVLTLRMSMAGRSFEDPTRRIAFMADVERRLLDLNEVTAAGITTRLPASTSGNPWREVWAAGQPEEEADRIATAIFDVTPAYLDALDVPINSGRGFTADEHTAEAPVTVISEGLARRLWGEIDPLGRQVTSRYGVTYTVVGTVPDLEPAYVLGGTGSTPQVQMYHPFEGDPEETLTVVARTNVPPREVAALARRTVLGLDETVPVYDVRPMPRVLDQVHWVPRFFAQQFAIFGMIALLIAAIGAYSMTAFAWSQRTREIGVRLALGASPGRIRRAVGSEGLRRGAIGAAVGLGLGIPMAFVLERIFQDVVARDVALFGGVTAGLVVISMLASWLAGLKATQVDPVEAIKAE